MSLTMHFSLLVLGMPLLQPKKVKLKANETKTHIHLNSLDNARLPIVSWNASSTSPRKDWKTAEESKSENKQKQKTQTPANDLDGVRQSTACVPFAGTSQWRKPTLRIGLGNLRQSQPQALGVGTWRPMLSTLGPTACYSFFHPLCHLQPHFSPCRFEVTKSSIYRYQGLRCGNLAAHVVYTQSYCLLAVKGWEKKECAFQTYSTFWHAMFSFQVRPHHAQNALKHRR